MSLLQTGCAESDDTHKKDTGTQTVVIFTALDRIYSEPILKKFEAETGITVKPVYDTEAAKTTGLVQRLRSRRDAPECDVHWNNEALQTERLAQEGLYQPYVSPNALRIPERFKHSDGLWTGFAARMRVIIYNTNLCSADTAPRKLSDFANPKWKGKSAIAMPFYGTTYTHMAVLKNKWGAARLGEWLDAIKANDVAVVPGNGPSRDMVAAGERVFGLTDTDDAHGAMLDGRPVAVLLPDDKDGAVLIPNTVALVVNCPNPDAGKALIDFLLSAEVEKQLAESRSAQIPLGLDLAEFPSPWRDLLDSAKPMVFDRARAAADTETLIDLLKRARMDR